MKKVIRSFMLVTLIGLLVACSDSTSSNAGNDEDSSLSDQLYFFNWGENMPQEILDKFEEEYGVEIIYDTFASNQEMLTKLNSGAVNYDLIVPTDYFVEQMIKEDLLYELNMENILNFKNIEEQFHERSYDPGNKYSVPYLYGSIGIAYNSEKVSNPTSWDDLWKEEYQGKVTVQETGREVVSMAFQKLGIDMNEFTDDDLRKAKEELAKLSDNILAFDSSPSAQLISGEAWISQIYSDQAGIAMAENPAIEFFLPEEGGMLWMDNLAIPKTAENKYTAEVFINYLLEPEISKMLSDVIPSSNPNGAAIELMSDEEKNNPASYPEIPDNAVFFEYLDSEVLNSMNDVIREIKVE